MIGLERKVLQKIRETQRVDFSGSPKKGRQKVTRVAESSIHGNRFQYMVK